MHSDDYKIYHKMDDEEGYYRITVGDHLLYRYEIIAELGRGSYGQVSLSLCRELSASIIR